MTDAQDRDDDQPVEDLARDTASGHADDTTPRAAVEQEQSGQDRSEEERSIEMAEDRDAPAAGVLDRGLDDPPEPAEPG